VRTLGTNAWGIVLLAGVAVAGMQCGNPEALKHRAVSTGSGGSAAEMGGASGIAGVGGAAGGIAGSGLAATAGASGAPGLAGADGLGGSTGTAGDMGNAGTGGGAGSGAVGSTSSAGVGGTAGVGGAGGSGGAGGTAGAGVGGSGGAAGGASGSAGSGGATGGASGMAGSSPDAGASVNYCDRIHWKATASVTGGDGAGPIGGIDGSLTTRWGNNKSQDGTDWYQVDFGGQIKLRNITLNNTQAYPDDYPGAYAVYGSSDGVAFDANPFVTGNGTTNSTVINFSERTMRAVKIKQTGTSRNANWWQIGEFQPSCSP
jgi:hypothetical protein